MNLSSLSILLLVVVATLPGSQGRMVDALYDSSVNFTCDPAGLNMTTLEPGQVTRIWLLPTAEVLTAGTTGHARVDVLNDGRVLHVRSVNDEDFGVYYCVVRVFTGEYLAVRHGINVNGAYWGDLFKQYYDNLITGLVAAAVCFVAVGSFCFLYNRHQAREDAKCEAERAEATKAFEDAKKPMTQYTNVAYVSDADEESGKKSTAPPPPDQQPQQRPQQQELQNVAADARGGVAGPSPAGNATPTETYTSKM